MVNEIKHSGADGLALQVTKPARSAGLVEENSDGEATSLADVRVYAFDHLLLVIDLDAVATEDVAELVVAAARDTMSIHRAMDATVQIAGHGYQVQLPPATDAGFTDGDRAPCHPAPGILVIFRDNGTSAGANAARLAQDIVTLRNEQTF
jgi:hypothetical protein